MFSLNADKCQNKQNCALTRYYSSCSLEHLKKAILQDSCTHKWNAIEVEWQAKGRVCSTPKELMASLKQHAQRYISMYCSFWRSSKGGSDPHMHNNSAKSRHVHRIAYVTKPLARDPSADITDREAVHQAPHTRCSKRSSQTSKAQLSIWRSWRRGQGRCDNSRHKLHMRARKITGSQPKWPTSKIEKKKKKTLQRTLHIGTATKGTSTIQNTLVTISRHPWQKIVSRVGTQLRIFVFHCPFLASTG